MVSEERVKIIIPTTMVPAKILVLLLILGTVVFSPNDSAHAKTPIVRAVLFYSPSCPHCHQVISQDLPPLIENYQEQLFILAVNTYTPEGHLLFQAVIDFFNIPQNRQGVPLLLVGDVVLVGSFEIPDQFPRIVSDGLAQGGIDWPDFPELLDFLNDQNLIPANEPEDPEEMNSDGDLDVHQPDRSSENLEQALENIENLTVSERFAQDYVGNSISVVVLAGMILVVGGVGKNLLQPPSNIRKLPLGLAPILIVIGFFVAIYMSYVEITHIEAVCGPVGDCNTVQQSSYAYLFGILPIGVLGVAGYLIIALTWMIGIFGSNRWQKHSRDMFFGLTLFGTLFSVYLTFLEPFIIGASCAWCLTSAVVMTLLLVYSQGFIHAGEG